MLMETFSLIHVSIKKSKLFVLFLNIVYLPKHFILFNFILEIFIFPKNSLWHYMTMGRNLGAEMPIIPALRKQDRRILNLKAAWATKQINLFQKPNKQIYKLCSQEAHLIHFKNRHSVGKLREHWLLGIQEKNKKVWIYQKLRICVVNKSNERFGSPPVQFFLCSLFWDTVSLALVAWDSLCRLGRLDPRDLCLPLEFWD